MKLVIEISEDIYKTLKAVSNIVYGFRSGKTFVHACLTAIRNGIPLPKGHGRLIDADAVLEDPIGNTYKDIEIAETIIEADNESEAADL